MTTSTWHLSDLALRPRLRAGTPVLRRTRAVQIGVDSPEAILITPAGPGLARWLRLLDGSRGVAELDYSGARLGLPPTELRIVLERLDASGLLDTDATPSRGQVRLIGAGRIGRAIARLLAAAPLEQLELVDDDPVDRRLYPRHAGLGRQASALQAELAGGQSRDAPGPRISIGPPAIGPELTVIASDRLDVDRMVSDALLRADQAHLLVRDAVDGIVVGPLVLPGRTSCVRCSDLVRCDADPEWPAILAQLCRTTGSATEPMIGWAAGTAVAQVLALLSASPGRWPDLADTTVELGRDYRERRRRWPRHPACGCGWTAGYSDEYAETQT